MFNFCFERAHIPRALHIPLGIFIRISFYDGFLLLVLVVLLRRLSIISIYHTALEVKAENIPLIKRAHYGNHYLYMSVYCCFNMFCNRSQRLVKYRFICT